MDGGGGNGWGSSKVAKVAKIANFVIWRRLAMLFCRVVGKAAQMVKAVKFVIGGVDGCLGEWGRLLPVEVRARQPGGEVRVDGGSYSRLPCPYMRGWLDGKIG